jgi:hypothetical protein
MDIKSLINDPEKEESYMKYIDLACRVSYVFFCTTGDYYINLFRSKNLANRFSEIRSYLEDKFQQTFSKSRILDTFLNIIKHIINDLSNKVKELHGYSIENNNLDKIVDFELKCFKFISKLERFIKGEVAPNNNLDFKFLKKILDRFLEKNIILLDEEDFINIFNNIKETVNKFFMPNNDIYTLTIINLIFGKKKLVKGYDFINNKIMFYHQCLLQSHMNHSDIFNEFFSIPASEFHYIDIFLCINYDDLNHYNRLLSSIFINHYNQIIARNTYLVN